MFIKRYKSFLSILEINFHFIIARCIFRNISRLLDSLFYLQHPECNSFKGIHIHKLMFYQKNYVEHILHISFSLVYCQKNYRKPLYFHTITLKDEILRKQQKIRLIGIQETMNINCVRKNQEVFMFLKIIKRVNLSLIHGYI